MLVFTQGPLQSGHANCQLVSSCFIETELERLLFGSLSLTSTKSFDIVLAFLNQKFGDFLILMRVIYCCITGAVLQGGVKRVVVWSIQVELWLSNSMLDVAV